MNEKKNTKLNHLSFHLKKPEKEQQIKPKVSRRNNNNERSQSCRKQ